LHIRHTDVPEWINPLWHPDMQGEASDAAVFLPVWIADPPESAHPAFSLHIPHSV